MARKPVLLLYSLISLIGVLLTAMSVQAASSSTATQAALSIEKPSIFSGLVNLSYSQSLIDHEDGTKTASRTALMMLSAVINRDWSAAGKISYTDDLRDPENVEAGASDLLVALSNRPRDLTKWLAGAWTVSAVAPTSELSNKVQGLQAAIGTSYKFALTPAVLAPGFETSLTLGLTRNFHRYETDTMGNILNPYGLQEIADFAYTYKKWVFTAEFIHLHGFAYDGYVSQSFQHSEEVGFSVLPTWKLAVGHTNAGSWLGANNRDSNLKLINEDDSVIYASTELSF